MGSSVEDAPTKAPFFKCRKYNILGKALENCEKGNTTVKRSWFLKRVLDYDRFPVDDPPVDTEGMGPVLSWPLNTFFAERLAKVRNHWNINRKIKNIVAWFALPFFVTQTQSAGLALKYQPIKVLWLLDAFS